jgi:hypothetical protein
MRRFLIGVLLVVALIYGAFLFMYPTCTFRYKLTAEVMTPDGLKTGSSVIEVRYSSVHPLPNPGRWGLDKVTGEAVYVDLGGGKNLFILLGADRWERAPASTPGRQGGIDGIEGGNDAIMERQLTLGSLDVLWLPISVYKLGRIPGQERDMARRVNAHRGEAAVDVPLKNVPLIGSFADLQKPETFATSLPTDIREMLGNDYVLQAVKIQIVDEAVSDKMGSILPWLPSNSGALMVKGCSGRPVLDSEEFCRVYSGSFKVLKSPHVGAF